MPWIASQRLPHELPPACYSSPEFALREQRRLFDPAWHLVATTADIPRAGDFVSVELVGHPIIVRNTGSAFVALSNVCAHRHCLLTSLARGNQPTIRCQYHGWEYDDEGCTGRIPEPKNFVPWERGRERLPVYRLARCGQLIFVSLAADGPEFGMAWGADNVVQLAARFDDAWGQIWSWEPNFNVNWKVPIENSVEGYHIPSVHPNTFKISPFEATATHVLEPTHTVFRSPVLLPTWGHYLLDRISQSVRSLMKGPQTGVYEHHHWFPNLMTAFDDTLSLAYGVQPTGPSSCRAVIRLFMYRGVQPSALGRAVRALWSPVVRGLTWKVLSEDMGIYAGIQRGLETSPHPGCLGRIEERIHAFQSYVAEATDLAGQVP